MRFWEEMESKYGFGDGDAMPDGAAVYRTVYLRAVNYLAAQLGSSVRAAAYDRPGLHNSCMVLYHEAAALAAAGITDFTQSVDGVGAVAQPDTAMRQAIRQAYAHDLDQFVRVTVQVDETYAAYVDALRVDEEFDEDDF